MYASIDIGTNTVLLLVAEYENKQLRVLHEEQRAPRLGRGVDEARNLHPDSVTRVLDALKSFKQTVRDKFPNVSSITVTATSAVRDSGNRKEFIRRVFKETGLQVTVLSGEEEAEYTYAGALSVLPQLHAASIAVLDIGGGSSEVGIGDGEVLSDRFSFNIGSVRFTERFLKHDPPLGEEIVACMASIRSALEKRPFEISGETTLVGVAGTVTSLAYIIGGHASYGASLLNGMQLQRTEIQHWIKKLAPWTSRRLLEEYPQVMQGRADVFYAGLLILREFMNHYALKELTVSTGGIRHGAIIKGVK